MAVLLAALGILAAQAKQHKHAPPTDKWLAPAPRVYASPDGEFGLKVVPVNGGAVATLFSVGAEGTETVVWERALQNIPVEVFVSSQGHVATVDNWGGKGKAHALVMYDKTGRTVSDRPFGDLFPGLRANANPMILITPSSIHWTVNAQIGYVNPETVRHWSTAEMTVAEQTAGGTLFKIVTGWGETLLIDPDSGKVLSREKK